ncbi:MAG: sugar phosphate nucleotidyltransferase, partial [Nitrososphaerales archaeon]
MNSGALVIHKAVIAAAGMGTRLLSATKELPKEMLPIFSKNGDDISIKPILQIIFEQLDDLGIHEFCFIVGRGKRAIEDHFTPDLPFLDTMSSKGRHSQARDLTHFYDRIIESQIVWVNQPKPMGFGDAVMKSHVFTGVDDFIVHAGDTTIISSGHKYLKNLVKAHEKLNSDCTILTQRVDDPRNYGVINGKNKEKGILKVSSVIEKPAKPKSNLAILPVYIFKPSIFEALQKTKPGVGNELQLTDGIQTLIEMGHDVYCQSLPDDDLHLDIGNPSSYWNTLQNSHKMAL